MDSYSSPVAIKHVFKVSEEKLKTKLKSEGKIYSKVTEINGFPGLQCGIDLKLEIRSDKNGEEKEMIMAYLTLLNIDDDMNIYSNFVFYIKSSNFIEYFRGLITYADESWGDIVCSLSELFDPEKKYIVDGEFIIEMKGIIFVQYVEMNIEKSENCLSKRLWNDEDEKDFTIAVGKENEQKAEIKVHKCILSACSPVFKRMLKTDMKEKQEGKVDIIDFDSNTVKIAVAFCYEKDFFENYGVWQQLISLHQFADKYDIEELKHQTESYLVLELSLEDICEVTNDILNLNAPKLRDYCFQFLLMAVKEGVPVKDMEILDKDFGMDLLKKVTSVENC